MRLRASLENWRGIVLLDIKELKKSFRDPGGAVAPVLDIPSFSLDSGEECALHGPSGTGKTTLLHTISGILVADSGKVAVQGHDLARMSENQRDKLRAEHIGYVFQTFNLLEGYSALENVYLALAFAANPDRAYAESLLERLGLGDRLGYRPSQLSIGQRQRVALARALVNRPALVLADEPTGNLDRKNAGAALDLMRELCREVEAAILLVSHDREVLDQFDRSESLLDINRAGSERAA